MARALLPLRFYCSAPVASTPPHVAGHMGSRVAVRGRDGRVPPPAHPAESYSGETNRPLPDRRVSPTKSRRDQALVDVPPSIGPIVFGTLGVGWVMVRCPREYDELLAGAGAVWEPGARQWLVERRIGPVIRELERTVDPLSPMPASGCLRKRASGWALNAAR